MKSSEIFPNVRNFRWFDNSYIDQLKQELKGVGNITKGKNDLELGQIVKKLIRTEWKLLSHRVAI